MSDGMPLPWPFPWSFPNPASSLSSIRTSALIALEIEPGKNASDQPFISAVQEAAAKLSEKFSTPLPVVKAAELYLIQALGEPIASPMAASKDGPLVVFPPEFLFVLDVGLEHLVGGSVIWETALPGYGDPEFPWKKEIALRSVRERTYRGLVYPAIAGSLMIGLVDGTDLSQIQQKLTDFGLQDVAGFGFFATANCAPFEEASICKKLENEFDFVKYAEMNNVVRIIDFSPGWSLTRLI
ncbi:hypothetical protein [Rhizobium mongolense]